MPYNTYPAVDDTTKRFPSAVENALLQSAAFIAAVEALIPNIPDQGSTARVKVVTGLEVRPNVDFVIWLGGSTKPANMYEGDIQLTTSAVGPVSPPTINTSSFNSMIVSAAFSQIMAASGVGPFTWSATGLPAGLTMSSSGVLSGVPTSAGSGSATITASNSGGSTNKNISWTVSASATAPVIASSPTPSNGQTGSSYTFSPGRTGSTPMTWGVSVGSLPPGLTINSSTGVISGTPTTAGSYSFTLQAVNSAGSDTQDFSITIVLAPEDIVTVFGGTPPTEPISYTDAASGSWNSHMFYVPLAGASMEGATIVGARLYIPVGSPHIGQSWKAGLVAPVTISGASFGGQAQYASNGYQVTGDALVAGWNEVDYPSEHPMVDNGEGFMVGVMIGDGTRYVHVATGMSAGAIFAEAGANFVLSETEYRGWYRDDQFDSVLWYGIDVKVRVP